MGRIKPDPIKNPIEYVDYQWNKKKRKIIGDMIMDAFTPNTQRGITMAKVSDFAILVTKREGGKRQVNIAQTRQIINIIRTLLKKAGIDIYRVIGTTPIGTFRDKQAKSQRV